MVLWEITLGTAYFLGLRRTYRLALKIQRRVISPKYPRVRQFVLRRVRSAFDIALKVHRNVQQRDLEVGRNLGNWILRWLDRMKPSANISGGNPTKRPPSRGNDQAKYVGSIRRKGTTMVSKLLERRTGGHFFSPSNYIRPKTFPTLGMLLRPSGPAGLNLHSRHMWSESASPNLHFTRGRFEGVYRKDIMLWMMQ
ncbi:hypothetical protein H6P81_005366 [Aristolochia fimbriata]|uniref:Uncharacterized protein n=1 Tax=Aristolochia fimbriata TaxID=158543 RepID=A0AAV7EY15_ARIFI|nr:hypothetical protein H6P81_005366 [Aristolochia fimbriata]